MNKIFRCIGFQLLLAAAMPAAQAQCILLKVRMNECVSCYNSLQYFEQRKFPVPLFAVFPAASREDSADIDFKLRLGDNGVTAVFNDALYKRIHRENTAASTVSLLDARGAITQTIGLKDLTRSFVSDSLRIQPTEEESDAHYFRYSPARKTKFDRKLGKIRVYDRATDKLVFSVASKDIDFNMLKVAMTPEDRSAFEATDMLAMNTESNMNASFRWAVLDANDNLHAMILYLNAVKVGDTTYRATDRYAVARYDRNGKLLSMQPFFETDTSTHNQYTGCFVYDSTAGYLAITHNWHTWFDGDLKKNPDTVIEPLTAFRPNGPQIFYAKNYPIPLPKIYREKYFDSNCATDFTDYPLFTLQFANDLYNVETGRHVTLIDDKEYLRHIDFKAEKLGDEPLEVKGVFYNKANKEGYVLFRRDSTYLLDIYDAALNRKSRSEVRFPGVAAIDIADVDPYGGVLYLRNYDEHKYLGLPLDLFRR